MSIIPIKLDERKIVYTHNNIKTIHTQQCCCSFSFFSGCINTVTHAICREKEKKRAHNKRIHIFIVRVLFFGEIIHLYTTTHDLSVYLYYDKYFLYVVSTKDYSGYNKTSFFTDLLVQDYFQVQSYVFIVANGTFFFKKRGSQNKNKYKKIYLNHHLELFFFLGETNKYVPYLAKKWVSSERSLKRVLNWTYWGLIGVDTPFFSHLFKRRNCNYCIICI